MVFSKKVLTIILIVLVIGIGAYFGFIRKSGESGTGTAGDTETAEGQKPAESPLPVKVARVQKGDLVIKLQSPGEAVTNLRVDVKAEVSGVIKTLHVSESMRIKKGALLVELDDRDYTLDLENSEARRLQTLSELLLDQQFSEGESAGGGNSSQGKAARNALAETEELFAKGVISREEYARAIRSAEIALIESGEIKEEIRAAAKGLTQAEIEVRKNRLKLEKTKIFAPFSGIITDIQISPNENVGAGTVLFTLVNIDRVQVNAKVLESEIGKMAVNREVDLKFSAYPGEVMKGRVSAISPIINPDDKTCRVIIDVPNPEARIKPGMHAEVEIAAEIYHDRLLVPQDAVLTRGGRKLVFAVEDGMAKWKYIQIGLENEDFAEVLPDENGEIPVTEGMQLLVEGHFTIAHDAKVRVIE